MKGITLEELNSFRENTMDLFPVMSENSMKMMILKYISSIVDIPFSDGEEGKKSLTGIINVQSESVGHNKKLMEEWFGSWYIYYYDQYMAKGPNYYIAMACIHLLHYASVSEIDFVEMSKKNPMDLNCEISKWRRQYVMERHTLTHMCFRLSKKVLMSEGKSFITGALVMMNNICQIWNIDLWTNVELTIYYLKYSKS